MLDIVSILDAEYFESVGVDYDIFVAQQDELREDRFEVRNRRCCKILKKDPELKVNPYVNDIP